MDYGSKDQYIQGSMTQGSKANLGMRVSGIQVTSSFLFSHSTQLASVMGTQSLIVE